MLFHFREFEVSLLELESELSLTNDKSSALSKRRSPQLRSDEISDTNTDY